MLVVVKEAGEDELKMAKRRAVLDVWVALVETAVEPHKNYAEKLFHPDTAGRFLVTENECPDQCGHNDFKLRLWKESRIFHDCDGTGKMFSAYVSGLVPLRALIACGEEEDHWATENE